MGYGMLRKGSYYGKRYRWLSLNWGDGAALVELVEQMALRQGIGDLLAEGVAKASKQVGRDSGSGQCMLKAGVFGAETRARTGYALATAVSLEVRTTCTPVYAEFGSTPQALALIKKISAIEIRRCTTAG